MRRSSKVRRFFQFLWGGWELWGVITTIGVGTMSEFALFLLTPFLQNVPLWLKVIYGFGLFLIVIAVIAVIIRVLQALFRPQNDEGLSQSISQTKAGGDILQAGRDINVNQIDNIALEFSVKIEQIQSKGRVIYFDRDPNTQQSPPWLSLGISFRTNRVIQIASLYIQIDAVDPRDTIEPDEDLAQGFSLPHTLQRSETHQFQFRISPSQAEGEHSILLRVLAGGKWYEDGPYNIKLWASTKLE